jgi:hypothetical protein
MVEFWRAIRNKTTNSYLIEIAFRFGKSRVGSIQAALFLVFAATAYQSSRASNVNGGSDTILIAAIDRPLKPPDRPLAACP